MSLKRRIRTLVLCFALIPAAFGLGPMRPDEIAELLHTMQLPKVAQTLLKRGNQDKKLP